MAFDEVVHELKQTEQQLQTQLAGIRAAISALEGGPAASAIRRAPGRPLAFRIGASGAHTVD